MNPPLVIRTPGRYPSMQEILAHTDADRLLAICRGLDPDTQKEADIYDAAHRHLAELIKKQKGQV